MKSFALAAMAAAAPVALASCTSRPKPTYAANSTTTSVPSATGAGGASATSASASTCTVTAAADVASAVASCTSIELSNLVMPANVTLDLTELQNHTSVVFSGTTQFGFSPDEDFNPIEISGSYITVTGAPGSVIDGNGSAYWDGLGSNGGAVKPDHFFVIQDMYNASFSGLYIQNWPTHLFYVTGNDYLSMTNLVLNNSAGDAPNSVSDGLAAAHNSDGFDISSSNYVTLDSITVYNQDDCVAVTSGTQVSVSNMYCSGGHGLSIGSIGGKSNNVVDGVTFSDSVVVNSQNGVRIKSNSDTTGSVSNITYRNITLSGISDYGLDVQQDYLNGGPTGIPTNGVNITGLVFEDITGTVESDAYGYYILCGSGSCSNFTFTNVAITGGNSSCNYPTDTCLQA
ncbi:hypothetical protein N0V93_008463 [Gnomoniopsis smithogilvyi]|uniref:endo-polygalacturonase n=1 Tax=Gnomoniopsis smithogilvyi TaxID=1191159 RepID=A0A9W8YLR4_9PEZI|nr:hypothetical protein N0V93_008463 [Gnomoniopsis smithogilvyi]